MIFQSISRLRPSCAEMLVKLRESVFVFLWLKSYQKISGNQVTSNLSVMFERDDALQTTFRQRKSLIFVLLILNLWGFTYLYSLWLHTANRSGGESNCQSHPLLLCLSYTLSQETVDVPQHGQGTAKEKRTVSWLCSPNEAEGDVQNNIIRFPHSAAPRHASPILHSPWGLTLQGSSNHWTLCEVVIHHFKTHKV